MVTPVPAVMRSSCAVVRMSPTEPVAALIAATSWAVVALAGTLTVTNSHFDWPQSGRSSR